MQQIGIASAPAACAAAAGMLLSPALRAGAGAAAPASAVQRRPVRAARNLYRHDGVKSAAAPGPAASTSSSTADPPQQQQFQVGASVYDLAHHGSCRGYGYIQSAADPAPDGTPRWIVDWDKGQRKTAIKEQYLELDLISHLHLTPPTALHQPVLVVLGSHKGSTGTTIRKSGINGFTCKLDGIKGKVHCNTDSLHATEPPPPDTTLQPFEPELLAKALPVPELEGFLQGVQEDPPIDLRRSKPDSGVWYDVLTGQRCVSSLPDDEVARLRYLVPGRCSSPQAEECASDGSQGTEASACDVASIRTALQTATEGSWTIELECPQASKYGCPYAVKVKHCGNGTVDVWQTGGHQFHDPYSPAELCQLRMGQEAEALARLLLRHGILPTQVTTEVNNHFFRETGSSTGCPTGSSSGSGSGEAGLAVYSNARRVIALHQVQALQKRLRREAGFGLTSDEQAVAVQMAVLQKDACVPFYQPYKQGSKEGESSKEDEGSKEGQSSKPGQPLIIILQTPFQKRMLLAFGRRVVFLDATGGTNKYGYMMYALVVQDESGRGVPVGFMITSEDTTEVIEKFLRVLQDGAQEVAKELKMEDFKFGYIVIDKSKAEIAAVKLLQLSGDALGWLLCYFHFLQDWERFLTSSKSGVGDRDAQHKIMLELARLAHCKEESAFKAQLELFYAAHAAYPAVRGRMKSAWWPVAAHWAWYGRVEVLELRANTNNLVERCFGLVKYTDLGRKAQSTIQQLVDTLLTKTVARNMQNRALMLAGRTVSDQQRAEQRTAKVVGELVANGAVKDVKELGRATVQCGSGTVQVCIGDLSCACSYSAEYVCMHIDAAAQQVGYTPALRMQTATYLASHGLIQVDDAGICCCPALGDPVGKSVSFRPADGFCTCHGWALHNTCCHLLAAPQLPAFQGVHLPAAAHAAGEQGTDVEPIVITCHRTFQQAPFEPLGSDEGRAELLSLLAAPASTAAAVRQSQSNADPAVSEVRADLAVVQRTFLALPEGEEREELRQRIQGLRADAERLAEAAHLQPTETRAGKQERRRNGRPENQRITTALFPGRNNTRSRNALVQQQQQAQPEACSDAFPKATKKGKPTHKMRGPTVPGNIDGTVLRNGAAHHRRPKRRRVGR